jgi:hypothetical protein
LKEFRYSENKAELQWEKKQLIFHHMTDSKKNCMAHLSIFNEFLMQDEWKCQYNVLFYIATHLQVLCMFGYSVRLRF